VYVEEFFAEARRVYPRAILRYNNYGNSTLDRGVENSRYGDTKEIVDRLKSQGLIDVVGVQMHLNTLIGIPDEKGLIAAFKEYGIPVHVTELDIRIEGLMGTEEERFRQQADVYEKVTNAIVKSGVCKVITDFQLGDKFSYWEDPSSRWGYSANADPTVYRDDLTPKPALYAQRRALLPQA
jgi:GH35 family endo-1,4-beta-xylanase